MVDAEFIVNVCALEVPKVLLTVTDAVPALVTRLEEIDADNEVELPNVVVKAVPFQLIDVPEVKLVPVAVKVKAEAPAVQLEGDIPDKTGATPLMVKV